MLSVRSWQPSAAAVVPPTAHSPASLPLFVPAPLLQLLQPRIPSAVFRLLTSVVRSANNMLGGISFVVVAKTLGVQKSGEAAPAAPAADAAKGGKKKSQ